MVLHTSADIIMLICLLSFIDFVSVFTMYVVISIPTKAIRSNAFHSHFENKSVHSKLLLHIIVVNIVQCHLIAIFVSFLETLKGMLSIVVISSNNTHEPKVSIGPKLLYIRRIIDI